MKIALLQLNAGDCPETNLRTTLEYLRSATMQGACFILTPEVTNCVSLSRSRQNKVLQHEAEDVTLRALCAEAAKLKVWLSIGSLALKTKDADGRFANRSFLIDPAGGIIARYDKIHMFDVDVSPTERFRESDGYRPGTTAVVANVMETPVGMSICYDLRFPHLYRKLAQAGAKVLLIPSAFSPTTGVAHWEVLLRARAIETGCFVVVAAQTGTHPSTTDKQRKTYGHSMVVAPWGDVLVDAGTAPGITIVDLDLKEVAKARGRIAALTHDRPFSGPE